jgi:hypothetical protein
MQAIQQIIRDAENRNMPVRALGTGWSLSHAAVTLGSLLNTKPLNVIEVGFRPEHCDEKYLHSEQTAGKKNPADFLVFAQCGATISELNMQLEPRGLALSTSGAANGQTICGAISTGTHGGAWNFGAMQDFILGFHLISQQGQSHWIERASRPVMSQSFCDILHADLLRDDRLFNAALVSFGSFGVIHAVVLKAEPLYLLEQHLVPRPYDTVLSAMLDIENNAPKLALNDINGHVSKNLPFHFEVMLNPFAFDISAGAFKEKPGQSASYVRYMLKHFPPDLNRYSPTHHLLGYPPGNKTTSTDAFSLLSRLSELAPLYSPPGVADEVSKKVIEGIFEPDSPAYHGTILTPGATFGTTELVGDGLSCELGFAPHDIPKAIEVIIRQINASSLPCLPSLRFVRGSAALLAPTFFTPYTCMMEFPAALVPQTLEAYNRIWTALQKNNVPHTFHWGQCLDWGSTPTQARNNLKAVYGQRVDDWLAARKTFLNPQARQTTFANSMLVDCGLVE